MPEQDVGWSSLWCGELLHGRRFPQKMKGDVYKRYGRPKILDESDGNFMIDKKIHSESNVWSTAQRWKEI